MAKTLQLRRGTTAENDAFTGAVGEVTVDTEKNTLRVHDGSTVGGHEIATNGDIAKCLPLSGGTMTGRVVVDYTQDGLEDMDAIIGNGKNRLVISASNNPDNPNRLFGATLYLMPRSDSIFPGNFILRTGIDRNIDLEGKSDGVLLWDGSQVLTDFGSYVQQGTDYTCLKYNTGLMIQCGIGRTSSNGACENFINFTEPFAYPPAFFVTSRDNASYLHVPKTYGVVSTTRATYLNFVFSQQTGVCMMSCDNTNYTISWFAIGFWK